MNKNFGIAFCLILTLCIIFSRNNSETTIVNNTKDEISTIDKFHFSKERDYICNNGYIAQDLINNEDPKIRKYNNVTVNDIAYKNGLDNITNLCSEKINEETLRQFKYIDSKVVSLNKNFITINDSSYPLKNIEKIGKIEEFSSFTIPALNKKYQIFVIKISFTNQNDNIFFTSKEKAEKTMNDIINTEFELRNIEIPNIKNDKT